MAANSARAFTPDYAVSPGETLLEIIEQQGLTQLDVAERMGRPKKTINEIINGKAAITPETALQFERVLGISADFWNALEQQYRASLARISEHEALSKQLPWLTEIPVASLVKRGWVRARDGAVDQLREVLSYFSVASADAWREVWGDVRCTVAFRESPTFASDFGTVAAWLRRGEMKGREVHTAPFDSVRFRKALTEARRLSCHPPEVFVSELMTSFAKSGVALVFVPPLPKLRVCGATRWVSANKALMLLTNRHKTNDHFWFTIFHEAGHILLHGKRAIFVEPNSPRQTQVASKSDAAALERAKAEDEANRFARDLLIPPQSYSQFRKRGSFSSADIKAFAHEIGIAPGIVLGRLQNDEVLPFPTTLNKSLKETFELVEVPATAHAVAG